VYISFACNKQQSARYQLHKTNSVALRQISAAIISNETLLYLLTSVGVELSRHLKWNPTLPVDERWSWVISTSQMKPFFTCWRALELSYLDISNETLLYLLTSVGVELSRHLKWNPTLPVDERWSWVISTSQMKPYFTCWRALELSYPPLITTTLLCYCNINNIQ